MVKDKVIEQESPAGIVGIDIESFVNNAVEAKKTKGKGKGGIPKAGTLMRLVFDVVDNATEECDRDKLFGLRMNQVMKRLQKADVNNRHSIVRQKIRNYTITLSGKSLMRRVKINGTVYVMPRGIVAKFAADKKAWAWLLSNDEYLKDEFGN